MLLTGRQERELELRLGLAAISPSPLLVPAPAGRACTCTHSLAWGCSPRPTGTHLLSYTPGRSDLPLEYTCGDACTDSRGTLLSEGRGGGFSVFVCLSPEQVGILIPVFIYSAERVIHLLKRSLFIVCWGEGVRGDARE